MNQFPRYSRAIALLLILIITAPRAHAQNVRPLNDRIDAIVAHRLVLPIKVDDANSIKDGINVRLDDGRRVQASAYFIWTSSTTHINTGWTRNTPTWYLNTPQQYAKSPPARPGTWIAMIDLPIDAVGQGIWIDGTRYEPNWLPSPLRVVLETSTRAHDGFWDPALTTIELQSPLVENAIINLRADPFNTWRSRLMSQGFAPGPNANTSPANSDRDLIAIHTELLQSDTSHVLDDIAEHFAARWQIILGRIWLIDPAVAHRLKHQLTRTASAQNHIIPLWTNDTAQLSALAHDLLSPFVNDELRVERVVAWLESQPSSMSWIIDDSGHPSRNPFHLTPEIGLFQISDQPDNDSSSFVRLLSQDIDPHVLTIPSNTLTQTTLVTPTSAVPNYAKVNDPRLIHVQIGPERSTLKVNADIPLALPPGVLVGPLLWDWTLSAFGSQQSGLGALPPLNRRVAGLVHRVADINEPDPRVGWRLYLECAINPDAGSTDSTVQIWIGPMGSTRVSWAISRLLGLVETSSDPDINLNADLTSLTADDRWIIELNIPPNAISPDGLLTLGLERTDGHQHSSWPRRMMPWQTEPGRFTIDITGWTGTSQAP
ncbi:MAG: hypothetical protein JKY43_06560 [Phycisphaerales bacterium]|nr:hypothetical protein [Phycisphaerales bacterium]